MLIVFLSQERYIDTQKRDIHHILTKEAHEVRYDAIGSANPHK